MDRSLDGILVAGVARIDGLASGEAFVLAVIKTNAIFAQPPAEIDGFAVDARGKIEQADIQIFHYAAGGMDALERGLQIGGYASRSMRVLAARS